MNSEREILKFIEENLCYTAETGELTWLHDRANGKVKFGSVAGSKTRVGYLQVRIFGKYYKIHRLVWLIETGNWPNEQIDHINRVKSDNRFGNLRDATNYENCLNRGRVSKSGVVGVTWDKVNKMWLSQTYIDGKAKNLGRYKTVEDASSAYNRANVTRLGEGVL